MYCQGIIRDLDPQSILKYQLKYIFVALSQKKHFILKFSRKKKILEWPEWSFIGQNNIMASFNNNSMTLTLVVFSDFSKIFKFKFVHLGGDEVNTSKLAEVCTLYSVYVC